MGLIWDLAFVFVQCGGGYSQMVASVLRKRAVVGLIRISSTFLDNRGLPHGRQWVQFPVWEGLYVVRI